MQPRPVASSACLLGGETAQTRIELYFGMSRPGGAAIGDGAWHAFVAREVTPRFPDGLTEIAASGQWRTPGDGRIVHERSRMLLLVVPGADDLAGRIEAIRTAYRRQFDQQAVGIVSLPACAEF